MSLVEEAWWSSLEGDAIEANTAGVPPYDVDVVATRLLDTLDVPHWLDLGCGPGRLTNHLARRLYPYGKIVGVDISRPLLDEAVRGAIGGEPCPARYWHGDGRTIPKLPISPLSGAYAITLFQHIPADATWGYLRQVHELLIPKGKFVFSIAVGDDPPAFLNHQIADPEVFGDELAMLYDEVEMNLVPDVNGWSWVTVTK